MYFHVFNMCGRRTNGRFCLRNVLFRKGSMVLYCVFITCALMIYKRQLLQRSLDTEELNVYVVEEHHEALQYWYDEALRHTIGKHGNTLVHIDAHSDLAPPTLTPELPFFEWPANRSHMANMMQRNDVFIFGAGTIGMFERVIWIFPYWDKTITAEEYTLGLGYTTDTDDGSMTMCDCRIFKPDAIRDDSSSSEHRDPWCSYMDPETDSEMDIDFEKCILQKYVKVEVVVDNVAQMLLQKGNWLLKNESIVLDIDEDFFGCESGFGELDEAGVSLEITKEINDLLEDLICPKNSMHEMYADILLKQYISNILRLCHTHSTDPQRNCNFSFSDMQLALDKHITEAYQQEKTMFCSEAIDDALSLVDDLSSLVKNLGMNQIKALLQIGFCSTTSPTSTFYSDEVQFQLCHGVNLPGQSVVNMYTPEEDDLLTHFDSFYKMMDPLMELNPKLLTICRSIRDGYTPRKLANLIENKIVAYLKTYINKTALYLKLNYDDNLLGGIGGWDGRYMYNKS